MIREIRLKRAYEAVAPADGFRVLVDRLWPRGISKEKAAVDLWAKDIAPSNELRKWFGHDPSKFEVFALRYRQELHANPAFDAFVSRISPCVVVTLLFSAADVTHNNAVVLCDELLKRTK